MSRAAWTALAAALALVGCQRSSSEPASSEPAPSEPASSEPASSAPQPRGDTLETGLLVAASATGADDERPLGARLTRLRLVDGSWVSDVLEDPTANVFHHARAFDPPGPQPLSIVTLAGGAASVKLWRSEGERLVATELWRPDVSLERGRVRDLTIARLYGDRPAPGGLSGDVLVVGLHDQGEVAVLSPRPDGGFEVTELDRRPNTIVHEVEAGDLDGDGVLEVYAARSVPNAVVPGADQPGEVVRYVPAEARGPEVVLDLGRRHAKELLVVDLDADGRDELYVAVEARTEGTSRALRIVEPVEVRRIIHDGPPGGERIATLDDRMTRFLVACDLEGDGRRALIAATFSAGLFRLDPPRRAGEAWSVGLFDADSRGFEHATMCADLDADGADELYVADDPSGELRRYTLGASGLRREVIRRAPPRSEITWSLAPLPLALAP